MHRVRPQCHLRDWATVALVPGLILRRPSFGSNLHGFAGRSLTIACLMKKPGIIGSPDPPPGSNIVVVNSMSGAKRIRNEVALPFPGGRRPPGGRNRQVTTAALAYLRTSTNLTVLFPRRSRLPVQVAGGTPPSRQRGAADTIPAARERASSARPVLKLRMI